MFEMFAHRSIYHDGWRAVCPVPGTSFKESGTFFGMLTLTEDMLRGGFDAKHWELYDLSKDPTETTGPRRGESREADRDDRALVHGGRQIQGLPAQPSARRCVSPTSDPELTKDRKTYVYYPHTQMIPENVAAKLLEQVAMVRTSAVEIAKGKQQSEWPHSFTAAMSAATLFVR